MDKLSEFIEVIRIKGRFGNPVDDLAALIEEEPRRGFNPFGEEAPAPLQLGGFCAATYRIKRKEILDLAVSFEI